MSIARHHIEWIQLIEISGPFLSLPVLAEVFPQGPDPHDPEISRNLRAAFEERSDHRLNPEIHREWVVYVIAEVLGWNAAQIGEDILKPGTHIRVRIPEFKQDISPDLVIVNPQGRERAGEPRILIQIVPPGQHPEKPLPGGWTATPADFMREMLRETRVQIGILTNGEQWMLVYAPRDKTVSYVSWYASLWLEEPLTLRAFRSLLSPHRFFGVPDPDVLEMLFERSTEHQQELTDQLGYQVRKAVEVLVQAADQADSDRGRSLLKDTDEKTVYDAALTVMMRLVFLFCAEERELLLSGTNDLYERFYSVSGLREQLQKEADRFGEEVLERRRDAWYRLNATFRGIYGGMNHDLIRMMPYGGRLFDPDRYGFLEGRKPGESWKDCPSKLLPINNRTVLHLLSALQMLQVKVPGGGREARRLSFRSLDVEDIGHVYEGLLDHTAKRAEETILGLTGSGNNEQEIRLSVLESLSEKGEEELVTFLKKATGRGVNPIRKALSDVLSGIEAERLLVACDNDSMLKNRIMPYSGLLRNDTAGYPVVITPGSIYVTEGTDRRSTGTHYTPPSLTEPVVRHTLEPLVYEGPAEGKPESEWRLRSAGEILGLRVCDMAMGSGAFLVQACRYLAKRLTEAWEIAEKDSGRLVVGPEGQLSNGKDEEYPIPGEPEERFLFALRAVSERCLYGVDKNPMAAEMAKLSLWLVTMANNRPFTFLDHALKCGDSLLGADRGQLETWSLDGSGRKNLDIFVSKDIYAAIDLRRTLENVITYHAEDAARKEALHKKAEAAMARLKLAGDLILAPLFSGGSVAEQKTRGQEFQARYVAFTEFDAGLYQDAREMLGAHTPFHWGLEFPEIFWDENAEKGFDAVVGNPPFQGGQKITGALGVPYRNFLVTHIAGGKRGSADLCAYFFLRAFDLLRYGGLSGLLATNTIAQGDTREVGLDQIAEKGASIVRALPSMKWPGTASLEVALVWLYKGNWKGGYVLENKPAKGITPFLAKPGAVVGNPYRLKANEGKSFQGSIVLGMGFVLEPDEAQVLIAKNPKNADVLFPYLNGQDLNSHPEQKPSRWVINFFDWPLNRTAEGSWASADRKQQKAWLQKGVVPEDYPDPVAADYPDCFVIVEEKVKPERRKYEPKKNSWNMGVYTYWWRFGAWRKNLYSIIAEMERVLITARVSPTNAVTFLKMGIVFHEKIVIFPANAGHFFATMQSSFHWEWARHYTSTLGAITLNYSPSDCFETFPFPESTPGLEEIGEAYYTCRQSIMKTRQEGLTATYNRFHNPKESSPDIQKLRELHIQMDNAVANAYGWNDLDLDHGYHETRQGIRFTISETARREVLDRLLRLNHERYAQENALGLHDTGRKKKAGTAKRKSKKKNAQDTKQGGLF